MTQLSRNKALNILDELFNTYGLGEYLVSYSEPDAVIEEWDQLDKAEDELDLWFSSGATRLVIGGFGDYVLKLQTVWGTENLDYNKLELRNYESAQKAGFGSCFAHMEKLCDYTFCLIDETYSLPIYCMEDCNCDSCEIFENAEDYDYSTYCVRNSVPKSAESRLSWRKEHKDSEVVLLNWALNENWHFDEEQVKSFKELLDSSHIDDLHSGNWGWTWADDLVLTDYAGYFG